MIVGVLLAAGAGTRFGGDKLLFRPPGGIPIGLAALRNLKAALPNIVAVVRPEHAELRQLLEHERVRVIDCAKAELGMGHSLAAGVAAESAADGWVIALADMPRIRPDTIAAVARALAQGAELVVPAFTGHRGHPVGFSRRFREQLLTLSGDTGARAILAANQHLMRMLEVDDLGVIQDVDTRADAQRIAS
jgi:molybdenum cofactor cytidylyltransferase